MSLLVVEFRQELPVVTLVVTLVAVRHVVPAVVLAALRYGVFGTPLVALAAVLGDCRQLHWVVVVVVIAFQHHLPAVALLVVQAAIRHR